MKNKNIIRLTKKEYELDNGDVYPHLFELDDDITIKEFQLLLNSSEKMLSDHINNIEKNYGE